jgi:hypothetical protein
MDIFYFTHLYTSLQSPIPTTRLCKNCKFFLPNDPFFGIGNEYSKCALFVNVQDDDHSLVTGKKSNPKTEYRYCSIARKYEYMCGKEGKFYKRKHKNSKEE